MQPLLQWKKQKFLYNLSVFFFSLGIWHSKSMRHIVICGLLGSTVFFHISHKRYDWEGKKKLLEHKIRFDFLYNFYMNYFSF